MIVAVVYTRHSSSRRRDKYDIFADFCKAIVLLVISKIYQSAKHSLFSPFQERNYSQVSRLALANNYPLPSPFGARHQAKVFAFWDAQKREQNIFVHRSAFVSFSNVHTSAFSFENAGYLFMLYIVCCPHSTIENAVSQLSNLRFHLPTRKAFSNRCVLLSVMRSTDHTENGMFFKM